ncbi:30S ribosomal protein S5 [Candidatus Pacearchaeota archaeon]|nr:30S ribosomal protein S5 [Candidatus Pacearchaeota archaeon]
MAKKFNKNHRREKEVKEFEEEVLQIDRVTRVVKGGRRLRFRCLVAIGDKKGRVGVGVGKATEVVSGIKKAVTRAKQSLVNVPITDADSIPHEVHVKHKAARMFIMPAAPGTGVIAGGALRKILGLAGVKNVLSKNHGTNNKLVTAQAAIMALETLRPAKAGKEKKREEKKEAKKPERSEKKGGGDSKQDAKPKKESKDKEVTKK